VSTTFVEMAVAVTACESLNSSCLSNMVFLLG
jgi:hypothetical protein